jgi:hypothetical protein
LASSRPAILFSASISRIPGSIFSFRQIGSVIDTIEETMSERLVPSGVASRCV